MAGVVGRLQSRLAAVLVVPTAETAAEQSVITLRGPAFGGLHVVRLAPRGADRRGWRLEVDGRPGGTLAAGAVVRLVGLLRGAGLERGKRENGNEE